MGQPVGVQLPPPAPFLQPFQSLIQIRLSDAIIYDISLFDKKPGSPNRPGKILEKDMRLVTFSLLGAIAGTGLLASSAQAQEFTSNSEYDLVILNVELVDEDTGESMGRKDIFVDNGRFAEVSDHTLGSLARATNFATGSQYSIEDDEIRSFVREFIEESRAHS